MNSRRPESWPPAAAAISFGVPLVLDFQLLDDDFRKRLQVEAQRERGVHHSFQRPGRRAEGAEDAHDDQDEPQRQPPRPGLEERVAQQVKDQAEQEPSNWLEERARHH